METHAPPDQPAPPRAPPCRDYYHLVHTLARGLPPPVDDTPEALLARNESAIAEVAAMLPTNANEVRFAAQCVTARARADEVMELIRAYTGDELTVIMKLNAQYIAMTRASQGAHSHLLRLKAMRYKREQSDAALKADEWTQYIVTRSMEDALYAGPLPVPRAGEPSAPTPAATPAAPVPQPGPAPSPAAPPPIAPSPAGPLPMPAATPTPPPAPVAPWLATQPAAEQSAAPHPSRRKAAREQTDDPPRDLFAEVEYYAAVYPERARAIRRCRGLPPNCSFGPPDNDLVRGLLMSNSPALRALDAMDAMDAAAE
jgi:hypothetical protein